MKICGTKLHTRLIEISFEDYAISATFTVELPLFRIGISDNLFIFLVALFSVRILAFRFSASFGGRPAPFTFVAQLNSLSEDILVREISQHPLESKQPK